MRCRSFLGVTAHNIDNTRVLSTFQAILGTGRLSLGRLAAAWRKIWTNTQFSISPFKMFKSFCLPTSLTRLGCLFLSWNPNQSISCNLRITRSMKYPQTILSWCKITKLWLDQSESVRTQLTGVGSSFTAYMSCIASFCRLSFLVLGTCKCKWHDDTIPGTINSCYNNTIPYNFTYIKNSTSIGKQIIKKDSVNWNWKPTSVEI